jgi:hypothetical protein
MWKVRFDFVHEKQIRNLQLQEAASPAAAKRKPPNCRTLQQERQTKEKENANEFEFSNPEIGFVDQVCPTMKVCQQL